MTLYMPFGEPVALTRIMQQGGKQSMMRSFFVKRAGNFAREMSIVFRFVVTAMVAMFNVVGHLLKKLKTMNFDLIELFLLSTSVLHSIIEIDSIPNLNKLVTDTKSHIPVCI
mmetsp:Transcript_6887/g.14856  ORF Transcript_6887/g.14856 Transcript_6887/m.14856 type:complete len:112 (+) Transcript_6887:293-628(+)